MHPDPKDTLPYFLGAVDEEHFIRQAELDVARSELRELEAQLQSRNRVAESSLQRIRRYINDAKSVGILDPTFDSSDLEVLVEALENAISFDVSTPTSVSDYGGTIIRLQDDQRGLRERLSITIEEIRATQLFISEQTEFSKEASEHRARLSSLNLFKRDDEGNHCPLCESEMQPVVPNAAALRAALTRIEKSLDRVGIENPHLQKQLVTLNETRSVLESALVENQKALETAYLEDERARTRREMIVDRARVIGRISAFLEQIGKGTEDDDLSDRIDTARLSVKALEEAVNPDEVGQRLDTFLNLISRQMSEYAQHLDLEHGSDSVRLDLKKLTVVADTPTGPIPLNRMGSAENWVNYHVLTHLSLHHWYRNQKRPVPGFMIFDQPSQAHYPPDRDQNEDGSLEPLGDADRRAVHDLFKLMHSVAQDIGDGFQCIVLDHARIAEPWFNESIVEEWRGDRRLVPLGWAD